jgi:hypothetical protein
MPIEVKAVTNMVKIGFYLFLYTHILACSFYYVINKGYTTVYKVDQNGL